MIFFLFALEEIVLEKVILFYNKNPVNSGTHLAQLVEPRPLFLLFLDDNDRNMTNESISNEDFIFLKFSLTKFQKLASQRTSDLHLSKAIFSLSDKNKVR